MTNQTSSCTNWTELLYRGLQAGGAAFIVSGALSQAALHALLNHARNQTDLDRTVWFLVGSWFGLGLLCVAPIAWALKKRLENVLGLSNGFQAGNPVHVWKCREAAAFSLLAGPLWWLAPALLQMKG